jgi:hypothetical protein
LTPTNFEVRVGLNNNKSFSYVMHSTSVWFNFCENLCVGVSD